MELSVNFVQIVQDAVLRPDLASALGIFIASLINELFAVLPYNVILSGPLFFLEGSFSAVFVTQLFLLVAVPVGFGTALGSLLTYGLAYFGGKPAIDKFGKYVYLSWESVEKMESKFKGVWYDEVLFVALRSTPLLPSLPINAAAGILRMSLARYLVFTVIGAIIRMMIIFMLVGLGMSTLAQ
ncbi:MAG: hypothetical protein A3G05_02120 [Candidatus Zambryskibacteria bacterium RIFCSPLOWO2_12_FULL_45_14]|uniref:VTT domain-containing protein n=2 Tax=Candidatus Zambryskiibacteriota TaxID=1817925 RepID=A0A1G2UND5_9BACT|nr:MAG: hypothetical protein A3H60_02170 [Candidatus Zambryskibacteria bacterium RIFCSPLOWO2_02_FULL_44_12b]OHB13703.1 MAG: hypothetical protein A3G05_02120 [Candidatus Zambryskibacteria bacterium RIFCSPLOWO2_12_FULL_45_14]